MEKVNKKSTNKIFNIILSFIIVILTVFLCLKINFSKVVVNGSSMHPTLVGNYEDGYDNYPHINTTDDCVECVRYADTIIELGRAEEPIL